ncbi:MAG: diadenylate cyclase CdaA [Paludibacteraceae bacterium]|nr:diadenylate cyclase CdaA [Paludibacteraceae bacterium]
MFSFLTFHLKDFFDILLVAILLFQLYKLFKGTQSMNIFISIFGFIVIWLIVKHGLGMGLLGTIMDTIMSTGAIIIVVIFQDEIKRFLSSFGRSSSSHGLVSYMKSLFKRDNTENEADVNEITTAVENCATTKTGLLIIMQQDADLSRYSETGEMIDARVSARLIENIFFKNTPLHDGALIIHNSKIVSAGCILPVSHNLNIPKHYGLRHRAALGISEKTDAISIIVSEETGHISVARNGEIEKVNEKVLREILMNKK